MASTADIEGQAEVAEPGGGVFQRVGGCARAHDDAIVKHEQKENKALEECTGFARMQAICGEIWRDQADVNLPGRTPYAT